MNVIQLLESDHREVDELFRRVNLSEKDDSIEELTEQFWRYANLALPKLSSSLRIHLPSDPLSRLNLICSALLVPFHQKQQLLEEDDLPRRVRVTYNILRRESAELQAFRAAMKVLRGDEDAPPGPGPFSLN